MPTQLYGTRIKRLVDRIEKEIERSTPRVTVELSGRNGATIEVQPRRRGRSFIYIPVVSIPDRRDTFARLPESRSAFSRVGAEGGAFRRDRTQSVAQERLVERRLGAENVYSRIPEDRSTFRRTGDAV